jgi:hypothetical protein
MKYILTFCCVPTLSRHLYYLKQNQFINYNENNKNKTINFSITNTNTNTTLNILNKFNHNSIRTDNYIKSNLILNGIYNNKNIDICENTDFQTSDKNNTIFIKYNLSLRLDNSIVSKILYEEYFNFNSICTNNLWTNMSNNNYKIIKSIDNLIYENKNNLRIVFQSYVDNKIE